jgi:hypothetical protein
VILVRAIGMSGYVPIEGVVGLSHFWLGCGSDRCGLNSMCSFCYLAGVERNLTSDARFLRNVVSFAVFRRFSDSDVSTIVQDIGLLSGYHSAGALFPRGLFHLFIVSMGLVYYRDLAYIPYVPMNWRGEFLCSTAWAEYICLDHDFSYIYPRIHIQVLACKKPFPDFIREGIRFVEVKRMLRC